MATMFASAEDSACAGKGRLATSSAAQVLVMRTILENLCMVIATPEETREILQPK
ncbi:MAG: 3-keto-5-aminohexanoate cleavage protein [Boseongicola sp.]|nr:3-keto-5-aminohexanoate cleavage protein [Boseongicola sp.]MYH59000.1 3-keto-5-aminohexanoate cleavage protein [Boseongicola sp. SB0675_bin_26]